MSRHYLTELAHGCTPFITAFLAVHLASPAVAALGGSTYSSGMMLLGREYYQTTWAEPWLVIAPIVLHVGAGVAKRLLLASSDQGRQPRPLSSILTYTGYTLGFLLLPVHYMTHRIYPTVTDYPIDAIGPTELDYEFVKYGLQRWPVRSWGFYAGLIGCVALHGTAGMKILWQTWFGKAGRGRVSQTTAAAASGIVVPVLVGIFALSREPLMTFSSTAARFDAVFQRSWFYRI